MKRQEMAFAIALVVVFAAVLALVALPLQSTPSISSLSNPNLFASEEPPNPFANDPVTLNTVAYSVNAVNATVFVPDASVLGNGYRIVGVQIAQTPENATTSDGITYRYWSLQFVISNQPFINGTTLNGALYSTAVTFTEGPTPGDVSSYSAATDFMAPPAPCTTHLINNGSMCVTVSNSTTTLSVVPTGASPWQLVKTGSTYVVTDPSVPNAIFVINGTSLSVEIYAAGLTYHQMMALVKTVIP
jgi:hypothetical protein